MRRLRNEMAAPTLICCPASAQASASKGVAEMGTRKPMLACYEQVLVQAELKAAETVFIDDSRINIKGATQAGLHTILAHEPIGKWLGAELKKLEVAPHN